MTEGVTSQKIRKQRLLAGLILLCWGIVTWSLWIPEMETRGYDIYTKDNGNYSDGALHTTIASKFAYGTWENTMPVYSGEPLFYPWASGALTGITAKILNIPTTKSHTLWGGLAGTAAFLAVFLLSLQITKNPLSAALTVTLYLSFGGLGFLKTAWECLQNGTLSTLKNLSGPVATHIPDLGFIIMNPLNLTLSQRTLTFGIFFGSLLLLCLYKIYTQPPKVSPWLFTPIPFLFGLLPIIHPHTMMVTSLWVGWIGILTLKTYWKEWLLTGLATLLIAIPLLHNFTTLNDPAGNFIQWNPGVLIKIAPFAKTLSENPLATQILTWARWWILNWGLFLPLFLWAALKAPKNLKIFLAPSLLVFLAPNFIQFQPSDFDNTKLIQWANLLACLPIGWWLGVTLQTKPYGATLAILLVCGLTLSGFLTHLQTLQQAHKPGHRVIDYQDWMLSEYVKTHTEKNALIATNTHHWNPIPTLTGRNVLIGYPGWVWTWGLKIDPKAQELEKILQGDPQTPSLLKKYKIQYIAIPIEDIPKNPNWLTQNTEILYKNQKWLFLKPQTKTEQPPRG